MVREYMRVHDDFVRFAKNNNLATSDVLNLEDRQSFGNALVSSTYYWDIRVLEGSLRCTMQGNKTIYYSLFDSSLFLLNEINPKREDGFRVGGGELNKSIIDIGKSLYKVYSKALKCTYMVGHLYMNSLDSLQLDVYNLAVDERARVISSVIVGDYSDRVLTKVSDLCKALVDEFDKYKEPIKEVYLIFDDPDFDGIKEGRAVSKLHKDGEVSVTIY